MKIGLIVTMDIINYKHIVRETVRAILSNLLNITPARQYEKDKRIELLQATLTFKSSINGY
ncbi:hypothetical protein [Haloplasma contractile]|uniref:hypothetical protein n=1 Tax=Haloplasma contractile TaxID=471825 RepID=UPI001377B286|nr:hypothetical protein [Haloplasma contractile]